MLRIPVVAAIASIAAASAAFAIGDNTTTSAAAASSTAGATAFGGKGGSAKQGQAQGQIQGQKQTSVQKTNQDTRQLNKQSAESNSGGNTQGTTVEGDNVEGSFAFGYAAPSLALSNNNVIGNTEAITNWWFQVPGIGGGGGSATVHTTIGGVPLVAQALMIAGDPAYAASVKRETYLAKLTPEQREVAVYNPGPDKAMSRAYAAVMCVNFEDAAEAYGLTCE